MKNTKVRRKSGVEDAVIADERLKWKWSEAVGKWCPRERRSRLRRPPAR